MVERDLYMEVVDFLVGSGGSYRQLDNCTCQEVLQALDHDRFRLVRDGRGKICSFSTWWMIHEADLDTVRHGGRPDDVTGGTITYIADHAGTGAYPELIKFIRATICKKGVCWHHRMRSAESFRYYPEKKGLRYE